MKRSISAFAVFAAMLALVLSGLVIGGHEILAVDSDNSNDFELGDPPPNANILGSDSAGPDWADLFDANGDFKDVNPANGIDDFKDFGGIAAAFVADDLATGNLQDRTVFGGGSNKNNDLISTWTWQTGNTPAKDDISNAYTYATLSTQAGFEGDLVIYAGIERLTPNGDSHVDIEYNQAAIGLDKDLECDNDGVANDGSGDPDPSDSKPCEFVNEKTAGDFIVSMDFTNGGDLGSLTIHKWDGFDYVQVIDPIIGEGCNPEFSNGDTVAEDAVCGFSNDSSIDGGPWLNFDNHGDEITLLEQNAFTEFGINVTEVLGQTLCINSVNFHTRTSQSFTAELKDFALSDFNVCGSLKIKKVDQDGNAQSGVGFTVTGPNSFNENCITDQNGECNFSDVLPGTYSVTEPSPPTGFQFAGCEGEVDGSPVADASGDAGFQIELMFGEDGVVTCTNEALADLTIKKVDQDGNAQSGVGFTVTGPDSFDQDCTTDQNGECSFSNLVPGTYAVTEPAPPAGFELVGCTGTVDGSPVADASGDAGFQIVLVAGESGVVTCTNEKLTDIRVEQEGKLSYTIEAINDSDVLAEGVALHDDLPDIDPGDQIDWIIASTTLNGNNTVVCNIQDHGAGDHLHCDGTIASGTSISVTLETTTEGNPDTCDSDLENTATVSATNEDSTKLGDNTDETDFCEP